MFAAEFLEKTRFELVRNLVSESYELNESLPEPLQAKAQKVLMKYISTVSPAGLEQWIHAVNNFNYFSDALEELQNARDKAEASSAILDSLENDFGREDFRFDLVEKSSADPVRLGAVLGEIILEAQKGFLKINGDLVKKKDSYKTYKKYKKPPAVKGLDLQEPVIMATPPEKIDQIKKAFQILKTAWPYGAEIVSILTDRIHILQSKNLVSFSHFDEPGISYINVIDRELLDTVDDLVHENAHHHLNLILKKYRLVKDLPEDPVFFSPWRRTLRPIYGIFHAVFTFTFGMELFYNILLERESLQGLLKKGDIEKAAFRFLEEGLNLQYSFADLEYGIGKGWFTAKGKSLVHSLKKRVEKMDVRVVPPELPGKKYRAELAAWEQELAGNREKFSLG